MQSKESSPPPNRLRELRTQHGLQLYDIAALVRYDPSTISRWETGETTTVPDKVKLLLAAHYGVSVGYLMGWDDENGDNGDPEPTERAA